MADLMAYWRYENFLQDTRHGPIFTFNSSQQRLHSLLNVGDILWQVTGRREPGRERMAYYIVGRLVIAGKSLNEPGYRYGRLRVTGSRAESRHYALEADASVLLRQLRFRPQRPIGDSPKEIAQHLQTLRELQPQDSRQLDEWVAGMERVG